MPALTPIRASKTYACRPHTRVQEICAPPPLMRASKIARAAPSCARQRWLRQQTRVQRCTRCCHSRCKDAHVWEVTGAATKSYCLRSSSHVLPHDQEEREGGLAIKEASPPPIQHPGRSLPKAKLHFIFSLSTTLHFHSSSLQQQSSHGRIEYRGRHNAGVQRATTGPLLAS